MNKKIRKLLQYEYCLNNIADSFRTSDTSFKLDLEYNSLLNDIGKILEDICFILRKYRYVQEEKKIVIRRTAHKLRLCTNRLIEEEILGGSKDESTT